jgi:hypothetical protein
MQPLDKTLRNKLERTVKDAREIAESAAKAALKQLGVGEAKPFEYLSEEERNLRRRLRAHGRQLGDLRNATTEIQEIDRLIEEVAYEHWHRMLFARFLAENNLLMYPDPDDPVAVSLEECEDLAIDEGAKSGWELAARYATRMLPQIFRVESPVFKLLLPPENQQKLEQLIVSLEPEVFSASDSLGWVYQFWQTKRKDQVNASEVKIGARELPAVTQLFTEPYMVSFLLDNSLGAWWAGKKLSTDDFKSAASEDELRQKASLPGVPLEYLRFVKTGNDRWAIASGTFEAWPENLNELKILDPCCGSGHFLVAAFLMLVPMKMELEGLSAKEAVDDVLSNNLNGLEIDQRCVELAAFALAISAWRFPGVSGYRPLPELNLACSGLSVSLPEKEWKDLAGDDQNLKVALQWLFEDFKNAPILGSLINPFNDSSHQLLGNWDQVVGKLKEQKSRWVTDEKIEAGVVAHGMIKAATLLAEKYHWIVTNVPYKTKGGLTSFLQQYIAKVHMKAKSALETAFMDRCVQMLEKDGNVSLVLPQNWLFLQSYSSLRKDFLKNLTWNFVVWLGKGAFQTPLDVSPILILLTKSHESKSFPACDVSELDTIDKKSNGIKNYQLSSIDPKTQLKNPDHRITILEIEHEELLEKKAEVYQGLRTGDKDQFVLRFWEIGLIDSKWEFFRAPNHTDNAFGGMMDIIFWEQGNGKLFKYAKENRHKLHDMHESGNLAWGNLGVAVNEQGLLVSRYFGEKFDASVSVIFPNSKNDLEALWVYCISNIFSENVKKLDRKRSVTNATYRKIPFDVKHWFEISKAKYPGGLPKPFSNDPTQWIFHGHPDQNDSALHVAIIRLLGYRWPTELKKEMELAEKARKLIINCNNLFPFADKDGIVCIPAVRGEMNAEQRLDNLLAAAYKGQWSTQKKSELLSQVDHAGKSMETWLRDKFFSQHCKLFHHRPFIWQIWDGLNDGFSALINYHKLNKKLLETLIYTYLGDWINRQKDDSDNGIDGASEKLAAAENLKKKLELILEGEAPYDIFVRWKPIEEQPIGWNPDLNDGVRLNIRPFMSVPDVKKKGAGILRDKPNIKWSKDRGKDVETSPWYHLFRGDRINDHHLKLSDKKHQ